MKNQSPPKMAVSIQREIARSSISSDPYSIPLLIDDVKWLDEFHMTRCTFFIIEATRVFDDWVTLLRDRDIPFLLMGMSPVIYQPDVVSERFISPDAIDTLFNRIEDIEGLVVETSHIWLPNFLFSKISDENDPSENIGVDIERGSVWRVGFNLFQIALQFQLEVISAEQFSPQCRESIGHEGYQVAASPDETIVFREWSGIQFENAREHYLKQRVDPDLKVLRYRDKRGQFKAG